MTLEQFASLFEILGGAIVVITLIFLVIQLRHNTRALKSTVVLGNQGHLLSVYQTLSEVSMMEVILKGMPRPSDLTPVERGRFNAFWTMALQNYQQTYFHIRAGAYDENLFDGWWQVLRDDFLSPGFQLYWKQKKFILSREFQNYVEEKVMNRQPTAGYAKALANKGVPLTVNE